MGKFQVTQAQWKAVATLPKVNQNLQSQPSKFKGDNRPVEQVSWYDAIEFCARLSKYSGKEYRLPSEAEWEYACRAGTLTPFHFGMTITTDYANYQGTTNKEYKWSGSYCNEIEGIYRGETTPVGNFEVANAFGLYDMHGNVWEWCLDEWHSNYEEAPINGNAWLKSYINSDNNLYRILRGGSWLIFPGYCRSANRYFNIPDFDYMLFGLRVVCAVSLEATK